MSMLREKSDKEITQMLDDYGIKHGPVVETTRPLYEKKLKEAMSKLKSSTDKTYYREEEAMTKLKSSPDKTYYREEEAMTKLKSSPDKTYYREEEEEITYHITSRAPVREEGSGERKTYSRLRTERDSGGKDFVKESNVYDTPNTYRNISYTTQSPMKPVGSTKETPKSSRLIPRWVQFLIFLAVAAFLYFVFINMESSESGPFKKIV